MATEQIVKATHDFLERMQWCPTAVEKAPGILSSSPGAALDAEVESLKTQASYRPGARRRSARS
eukprot:2416796-Pyramimonas_sp.AAC.1